VVAVLAPGRQRERQRGADPRNFPHRNALLLIDRFVFDCRTLFYGTPIDREVTALTGRSGS